LSRFAATEYPRGVATLRMNTVLAGLGLVGLWLTVAQGLAQSAGAENLADRLGKAIDAGDANAAFRLAELYRSGEKQVPIDLAKAVSLYKTAARLGNHPTAMNALGIHYEQGWGVKASKALALQWYSKAARAGSAMAMANLLPANLLPANVFPSMGSLPAYLLPADAAMTSGTQLMQPRHATCG